MLQVGFGLVFSVALALVACGGGTSTPSVGQAPFLLDGEFTLDAAQSSVSYVADVELSGVRGQAMPGVVPEMSGTMTWEDNAVTSTRLRFDLSTLQSGVALQDDLVRRSLTGSAIAEFTGEGATSFGDRLRAGESYFPLVTRGAMSLNDVTRQVRLEDLRLITETGGVRFQGAVPIGLADYNIVVPASDYVVSETATITFDLFFRAP